jgi:hypothetical protein
MLPFGSIIDEELTQISRQDVRYLVKNIQIYYCLQKVLPDPGKSCKKILDFEARSILG